MFSARLVIAFFITWQHSLISSQQQFGPIPSRMEEEETIRGSVSEKQCARESKLRVAFKAAQKRLYLK